MNKKAGVTGIIIVLVVIGAILLFLFIRNRNTNPPINLNDYFEKEITNIDVSPDASSCPGITTPKQTFSARLSKQAPGTTYKGTLLTLSGSPTSEYILDISSANSKQPERYVSRKLLEAELWKKGFKILEVKFSSKTGWNPDDVPDEQWRNSGVICSMQPFVKALKVLDEQGMWPSEQANRFATGTSNGAIMLSYAIDYYNSPYAQMNRALLSSPILYDLYDQCKELPDNAFYNFYFSEQCHNADSNTAFFDNNQIKSKLNSQSCGMTLGDNSYLIMFGKKGELTAWYKDESERYVPDREALCPVKTDSWDAPIKYEGHAPIVTYYALNRNINPFVNYFASGEVSFN